METKPQFCIYMQIENKGIRAFKEEFKSRRYIVISRDAAPRRTSDGIDILPWRISLQQLWGGEILGS